MRHSSRLFSWLLAIFLPLFAIYPVLSNPIEEHAYDAAEFHIFRGVLFSAARADGSFYPRWVQTINGGLGGPLFEFYSPLSYFLLDVLNRFGIAHPIGWRVLTAMALLAASSGMFGLALSLFRRANVALLSAVIFCYNSYLLRDLFERGSPQGWAVALLPWLLWLVLRAAENASGWRLALASICFAAIILMHNATALLLTPVLALFLVFIIARNKRRVLAPIIALAMGAALAAFYLIPYLAEIQFVQFDNPYFASYALPTANPLRLEDFLSLPRVFDTGLGNNAMAESGGLFHAVALLLAIPVAYWLYREKRSAELFLIVGGALLVVFVMWMQTDSATWVWNAIPALNVFQFRWRLLSVMGFMSALLLGYFFLYWQTRFKSIFITLIIVFYILLEFPSLYPNLLFHYIQFSPRPSVAEAQSFALKTDAPGLTSFNEYLPRARQLPITNYATSIISNLPNDAKILSDLQHNGFIQTKIETPQAFTAAINVLYYPGWVSYVDGQAAAIRATEKSGLIAIEVPLGVHALELRYEGTLAQHLGDATSIAAAFALICLVIVVDRRIAKARLGTRVTSDTPSLQSAQRGADVLREVYTERSEGAQHDSTVYLHPRWWIPVWILLLAALKAFWIDPQTALFRATSTCGGIQDSIVHTNVLFDNRIRLCGYALSRAEFHPSDPLRMTIYWRLDSPSSEAAFAFVHLLGDKFNPETNNPLWGQQDKQTPGEHSIVDWTPGKLYRDVYEFRIAHGAPSGEYQIEIGWQDANGNRLKPALSAQNVHLSISHLDSLLRSGIQIR